MNDRCVNSSLGPAVYFYRYSYLCLEVVLGHVNHCTTFAEYSAFESTVHAELFCRIVSYSPLNISEYVRDKKFDSKGQPIGNGLWGIKWSHGLDWIEQCFTSPPTQYRLYGRRFLQVKRPNQQYQSTKGTYSTQRNQTYNNHTNDTINTKHSKSPSLH